MAPRTRKRNASTEASGSEVLPSKRARKSAQKPPDSDDVIIIEDSQDDDPEFQDILAQIKAQEESEKLSKELDEELNGDHASGSHSAPIDVDDDEAMARRLAEEWAKVEDMPMDVDAPSSDVEIVSEPSARPRQTTFAETALSLAAGSSRDHNIVVCVEPSSAGKGKGRAFSAPITRPDEALGVFKSVFTRTRNCTGCHKPVKSLRGCVTFSESDLPPSLTFLLHAPCSSCRKNHCRGCFKPVGCTVSCKGPSKSPKCTILDCCAEVRAIAIFEVLGGLDRQFILEQAGAASRISAMAKNAVKSGTVGPGGTGYGTDGHTSYGQPLQRAPSKKATGVKATRQAKNADNWEKNIVRAMKLLIELLPAPYSDSPHVYDILPHASVGHLISLSQVPTILATLLRNDSVTDWISRKETYNTMLSLLRRMADCELTIQCLIGQRWETASTCGVEEWMWEDGEIAWNKNPSGDLEIAAPLYTYFKKLTKQSEAFQAGAMQMLGEGQDGDEEVEETMIEGTSLCGDIIATRDDLERAIAVLGQPTSTTERDNRMKEADVSVRQTPNSKKGKGRAVAIDVDHLYMEACEKTAFKHVSLADNTGTALTYSHYNYAAQLQQTQNSTRNPKNRLHLLKELAVTATSLPPGVWVRVDEVRNDAIKIMIAGPEGTPYAGGLFEFDCFIPIEYPNTPPLMHLRTTGGGTVRFNPNLYNNGKVCLSLLGTWPGRPEEQWSPKSTLLQVLVSIQSMILIDAPYYNEPGHGQANLKAPVSIAYNNDISAKTTRWAIVDWLKNEHRDGIWRDVIESHFRICKAKIRQQILEWSKAAPQIRSFTTQNVGYGYVPHINPQMAEARQQPVKGGLDLLEEYDKGIKIIESWGSVDGAE